MSYYSISDSVLYYKTEKFAQWHILIVVYAIIYWNCNSRRFDRKVSCKNGLDTNYGNVFPIVRLHMLIIAIGLHSDRLSLAWSFVEPLYKYFIYVQIDEYIIVYVLLLNTRKLLTLVNYTAYLTPKGSTEVYWFLMTATLLNCNLTYDGKGVYFLQSTYIKN